VRIRVPGVTDVLEGAHRPGHFDGVATVVARLFLQVQPDVAVFGRKDYQQLAVIRYLARDLSFPVEIVAGDTVREDDGLAMSSRNQYLSEDERVVAAEIHRTLQWMRDAAASQDLVQVEATAAERLARAGFEVDYAAVRSRTLAPAEADDTRLVALVAARLGRTRLIDNLEFERPGPAGRA
jgi:pantoate--beta-alanine ligase